MDTPACFERALDIEGDDTCRRWGLVPSSFTRFPPLLDTLGLPLGDDSEAAFRVCLVAVLASEGTRGE